jgi:hypothetical protein
MEQREKSYGKNLLRKRNQTVQWNIGIEKQPKSIKDHSKKEGNQPRWR